ncbi:MAG: hypothetical protein QOK07_2741 [Gemmatimonadaceae bacterium]|nr:hypothetical protein [Gemmatimonadaceae bacterium]
MRHTRSLRLSQHGMCRGDRHFHRSRARFSGVPRPAASCAINLAFTVALRALEFSRSITAEAVGVGGMILANARTSQPPDRILSWRRDVRPSAAPRTTERMLSHHRRCRRQPWLPPLKQRGANAPRREKLLPRTLIRDGHNEGEPAQRGVSLRWSDLQPCDMRRITEVALFWSGPTEHNPPTVRVTYRVHTLANGIQMPFTARMIACRPW